MSAGGGQPPGPPTGRAVPAAIRPALARAQLGVLTTEDLRGPPALLVVPLGATEQHGPHLPLSTDTVIAGALAERAADRLARDTARPAATRVVIAPTLAYGASGEHAGFPGTLSIGQAALALVVTELVRSAGPEFVAVVLVNGHGGNEEALAGAVGRLRTEGRAVHTWSPRVPAGDAHAGRTETSLLLALRPDLVRLDRAAAGATRPLAELWPALRAGGVAAVSPNGVLGDPTGASAEEGARLVDRLVDELTGVYRAAVAASDEPGAGPAEPADPGPPGTGRGG